MKLYFLQGTASTKGNSEITVPGVHNEGDKSLNYFSEIFFLAFWFLSCSSFVNIDQESASGSQKLSRRTGKRKKALGNVGLSCCTPGLNPVQGSLETTR